MENFFGKIQKSDLQQPPKFKQFLAILTLFFQIDNNSTIVVLPCLSISFLLIHEKIGLGIQPTTTCV